MIIIFVIVNIAHHILTVNRYFHNLQIFHNYILSCRRIISCIFSHFTGPCIHNISITYHIKMRFYASIEPHWIHKLFHLHATVTIHVSYYPSILFTTSSRCIPFEPLISTISSGCITESRYKATSPLSLKL